MQLWCCRQVTLCGVRFSQRCAIQIDVYLCLYSVETLSVTYCVFVWLECIRFKQEMEELSIPSVEESTDPSWQVGWWKFMSLLYDIWPTCLTSEMMRWCRTGQCCWVGVTKNILTAVRSEGVAYETFVWTIQTCGKQRKYVCQLYKKKLTTVVVVVMTLETTLLKMVVSNV